MLLTIISKTTRLLFFFYVLNSVGYKFKRIFGEFKLKLKNLSNIIYCILN